MKSNGKRIIQVLAVALCVAASGIAAAADFDAVMKRLTAAVEAGELTKEEAGVMLSALKQYHAKGTVQPKASQDDAMALKKARYEQLKSQLQVAVVDGKISIEDAKATAAKAERELFGPVTDKQKPTDIAGEKEAAMAAKKARYQQLQTQLDIAVLEGKVSPAEAKEAAAKAKQEMLRGSGKATSKPGAKFDGKATSKPGAKFDGKPASKPGAKFDGKPAPKPGAKFDGKPASKPGAKFDGKPASKPGAKFDGKPASKPG